MAEQWLFRRFILNRYVDVNDYSGTGIVVYGVQFPDKTCAYRWCTDKPGTTCVADSIEDVIAIHGHDGATIVEWWD